MVRRARRRMIPQALQRLTIRLRMVLTILRATLQRVQDRRILMDQMARIVPTTLGVAPAVMMVILLAALRELARDRVAEPSNF